MAGLAAKARWVREDLRYVGRMLPIGARIGQASRRARFPELLDAHAQRRPDRVFLRFEDRELTFGEVRRVAARCAHVLARAGVERGDPVAVMLPNRPELITTQAATSRLGAIAALVNHQLVGEPLERVLAASDARHVIVDDETAPAAESAARRLGMTIWTVDSQPDGARRLTEEALGAPEAEPLDPPLAGTDPFLYLYTSGTTGVPKPVRVTYRTHAAAGIAYGHLLDVGTDDVIYAPLPLYHGQGNIVGLGLAMEAGAGFASRRHFSASRFLDDARRHDATVFVYIGELCHYLVNQPPRPDDRDHDLRVAIGAGLRPEVWRAFQARFEVPRIVEMYGESEGRASMINLDGTPGRVGRPPPFEWRHLRLVRFDPDRQEPVRDADGFLVECEEGEPGLLLTRHGKGARPDAGYVHPKDDDERLVRDAFERGDVWFTASDLLRRHPDGSFEFVDRVGDTFRWKGENVSTREVEEALTSHPGVAEASVYGVEIPGREGRAGMAAVVPAEGGDLDLADLHRHVAQRLPDYAVPSFVRLTEQLEVTGTLKHRKSRLREEGYAASEDPVHVRDPDAGSYVELTDARRAALTDESSRRL